jgi:hypothetical protein
MRCQQPVLTNSDRGLSLAQKIEPSKSGEAFLLARAAAGSTNVASTIISRTFRIECLAILVSHVWLVWLPQL